MTRLVCDAVEYFKKELGQDVRIVRNTETQAVQAYELAGKGEFAGLVIPVYVEDDQIRDGIQVHSCTSISDLVASLTALFDQLHLAKAQTMLQMTIPKTNITEAESLVRFVADHLGATVQADQMRVLPRARSYAGPLKNSAILSYFTSFEVPLALTEQQQQHLTVWINKLALPGNRGVALFDTATNKQLSAVVPFKTVYELMVAAQLLVSPSPHNNDESTTIADATTSEPLAAQTVAVAAPSIVTARKKTLRKTKASNTKTRKIARKPGGVLRTRLHNLRTRTVLAAYN